MKYRRLSFGYTALDVDHEIRCLEALCEGFVRANEAMIAADPDAFPCCLGCGEIRYVPPENCKIRDWRTNEALDPDCQHVFGAEALVRSKRGTCIDLACYLAALYRVKEGDLMARVIIVSDRKPIPPYDIKPGQYHAMVLKGSGELVDPVQEAVNAPPSPAATAPERALAVGGANLPLEGRCNCGG